MEKTFLQECKEWLGPLGYTLAVSADDKMYTFTHSTVQSCPAIMCTEERSGKRYCKVYDNVSFKMFLTLSTGELQFKHPQIERYIKTFMHYSTLVETYPPF